MNWRTDTISDHPVCYAMENSQIHRCKHIVEIIFKNPHPIRQETLSQTLKRSNKCLSTRRLLWIMSFVHTCEIIFIIAKLEKFTAIKNSWIKNETFFLKNETFP